MNGEKIDMCVSVGSSDVISKANMNFPNNINILSHSKIL
jgi:hypothetical protein